jgi:PAS domain S-box-containing protein
MLFILDARGRVFDFSTAAASHFCLEPTDRGRPLLDLVALPDNRERLERDLTYALNLCSGGDAFSQALPFLAYRRQDNTAFPATLRLARERREGGAGHFLATLHAEIEAPSSPVLRPLQTLLETLISNARDGVLIHELSPLGDIIDNGARVLYANDVAASYLGFESLTQLLETPAHLVWNKWGIRGESGPVELATIPSWLAEQGGMSLEATLRFERSDGEAPERWLTVTVSVALSDEDSGPRGLAVFQLHDLTARRRADHELLRALQKQERAAAEIAGVLGQIADGVIITDSAGKLTFMNAVARRLYGVAHDELVEGWINPGACFKLDGVPYPAAEMPLARAIQLGETVQDAEWRLLRTDGAELWIQGAAAPLRDNTGVQIGAVMSLRDVTSQHQLVEELEHANRIKDDFLTILSHELRTPLTPLVGWVSLLRGQTKAGRPLDPRLLDQALEALETNIGQQQKIIEELLDAAHLVLGRARFQLTLYPLSALVRDALDVYETRLAAKDIQIEFDSDAQLPAFNMDIARLGQAISHVVGNAVEFSPVGGTIWIKTWLDGNSAILTVRDEGSGIDPEFLPHIFDLFRQGDSPFTRRHGGLGMGLTVVKAIVEAHGGTIRAQSPGIDKGTEMVIRLPLNGAA